jgi:hypothetical protein
MPAPDQPGRATTLPMTKAPGSLPETGQTKKPATSPESDGGSQWRDNGLITLGVLASYSCDDPDRNPDRC